MRAICILPLLLVVLIVFSGCGSSSKKAEEVAQTKSTTASHQAEFNQRCGDPIHFPITDECVHMAGDRGESLRRKSDLTIAVWRACALTPGSAETIRQELTAKGSAQTEVGQKMIGEMERTEQHSDSPCVLADLGDLDCVAGNPQACVSARNADPSCTAWMNDHDTQSRLHCIDRAVHNTSCTENPPAQGAASYFSDSPAQAEDCRHREDACLHTLDECGNAKDALQRFLNPKAAR